MTEVLTPEVITEVPLDKVIDQTLVKNNVTHQVISALKKKYSGMALKSLEDKQGYLEICEAKKEVRKIGIITEKLCKAGREDAIKIQKLWLNKEKEILAKIDEVQSPLEAEIKKYDDEQDRLADEEAKRQEERFFVRQSELLKMGATYANGCFIINDVSYESNLIKESDDDIYSETILPKYQVQFQRNESDRIAAEEKKKAEELELKCKQDELAEQQRVFNEQQAAFKKQQDEANNVKEIEDKKKADEYKAKQDAQNKSRMNQVMTLGMKYKFDDKAFSVYDVFVAEIEITNFTDEQWVELIQKVTPVIEQRKKDAEQQAEDKRLSDIEQAKQDAIKEEQERVIAENKKEESRLAQEAAQRIEDAAKASDKDKWNVFIKALNEISIPEFKSPVYKGKGSSAKQKIESIIFL